MLSFDVYHTQIIIGCSLLALNFHCCFSVLVPSLHLGFDILPLVLALPGSLDVKSFDEHRELFTDILFYCVRVTLLLEGHPSYHGAKLYNQNELQVSII